MCVWQVFSIFYLLQHVEIIANLFSFWIKSSYLSPYSSFFWWLSWEIILHIPKKCNLCSETLKFSLSRPFLTLPFTTMTSSRRWRQRMKIIVCQILVCIWHTGRRKSRIRHTIYIFRDLKNVYPLELTWMCVITNDNMVTFILEYFTN